MRHTVRPTARLSLDDDATSPRVRGNARLTAITAVPLLVLSIAQVVTVVLGVSGVLTAHLVIGFVLTPIVALKLGSTGWRMVKYYLGDPDFRSRGAPSMYFRILGPVLIVLTVVLFVSGFVTYLGPQPMQHLAFHVHDVSSYLWLVAVALHAGPHYLEAVRLAAAEVFPRSGPQPKGARARKGALIAATFSGIGLALALSWQVTDYLARYPHHP